jgi:hypothetical protein
MNDLSDTELRKFTIPLCTLCPCEMAAMHQMHQTSSLNVTSGPWPCFVLAALFQRNGMLAE